MSEMKKEPKGKEKEQGQRRWGFVGAGKMAQALIKGMIRSGLVEPSGILASDSSPEAREKISREAGVAVVGGNRELVGACDVVVLAVKPQAIFGVFEELHDLLTHEHLVISIAAGVTLDVLDSGLGPDCRLVRVMPNTPSLVGAGASAFCLGQNATVDDEQLVKDFLQNVGKAYCVPESHLDAVTGLSGSGPAFVYAVVEALSDGGVEAGLPRDVATALAAQTVLGAAQMVIETGLHTGVLKDQVASPAGTTIAGLHALERGGLRAALMDAVQAASSRARELSQSGASRNTQK